MLLEYTRHEITGVSLRTYPSCEVLGVRLFTIESLRPRVQWHHPGLFSQAGNVRSRVTRLSSQYILRIRERERERERERVLYSSLKKKMCLRAEILRSSCQSCIFSQDSLFRQISRLERGMHCRRTCARISGVNGWIGVKNESFLPWVMIDCALHTCQDTLVSAHNEEKRSSLRFRSTIKARKNRTYKSDLYKGVTLKKLEWVNSRVRHNFNFFQ